MQDRGSLRTRVEDLCTRSSTCPRLCLDTPDDASLVLSSLCYLNLRGWLCINEYFRLNLCLVQTNLLHIKWKCSITWVQLTGWALLRIPPTTWRQIQFSSLLPMFINVFFFTMYLWIFSLQITSNWTTIELYTAKIPPPP